MLATLMLLACGGLFCSSSPVDQNAERILFEVHGDGFVTAHVQIRYSGRDEDFAWALPVPSVPELDVLAQNVLNAFDVATRPQFTGGCVPRITLGCADDALFAPRSGGGGVDVLKREDVGPFRTLTLESGNAQELVDWLKNENYRVNDNMVPFMQPYAAAGMKFLAVKLKPGAGVQDIQPISIKYAGTKPMIPLVLTAVAAEPEMGVLAIILAGSRFGPENAARVEVKDADLVVGGGAGNNYFALVARAVDAAEGRGWVTEFAGKTSAMPSFGSFALQTPDENTRFNQIVAAHPYLTRLYTRLSPDEMTYDPEFTAFDGPDVSNIHEIPNRDCAVAPDPCLFTACNKGSSCKRTDDGRGGCACAEGHVARVINAPGQFGSFPGVSCVPASLNLMVTGEAALGGSGFGDPCLGVSCGAGTCRPMNGIATCECAAGNVAVLDTSGASLTCAAAAPPAGCGGAATVPAGVLSAVALAVVVGLRRGRRR